MSSVDTSVTGNQEAIEEFVEEALESLQDLPSQLEQYRACPENAEGIHAVFRAIHSMKGCAAFLDLDAIQAFSHILENTLDEVRNGTVRLGEDLQRAFIDGFDLLEAMLQEVENGHIAAELGANENELLERVQDLARAARDGRSPEEELLGQLLELVEGSSAGETPEVKQWGDRLRNIVTGYASSDGETSTEAAAELYPSDFVGARFVRGEEDLTDRVSEILKLFVADDRTAEDEQAFLDNVLAFAAWAKQAGESDLEKSLDAAATDFRTIFEGPIDFDDNLLSLIWDHLQPALQTLKAQAAEEPGKEEQETAAAPGQQADAPAGGPEQGKAKAQFVRVKEERIDEFLECVSRLFITSELFKDMHARMAETGQLATMVEELRRITGDLGAESTTLQQSVVALRRVSISGLFSKFPRMARTLASDLEKKITVHISGEETEIDKSLSEDLVAPITHMIRNVVDHGIETPQQRLARGVNEVGNLWLKAEPMRNSVRISIRDDGQGIDPVRLRKKAVEKGVISQTEADEMSDDEAIHLVFHPGFSTAEKVSEVSGRGVGMDAVRTTLAQYNGQVNVESTVGEGTTFTLEIPDRQATIVVDGLMVDESGQSFVVPFEHVREIAKPNPDDFASVHGRTVLTIRGKTYDAISLGDLLHIDRDETAQNAPEAAVVLACKHGAFCLLIDHIAGHRKVVVTSLKDIMPNADRMAGVARLGGGRLALVLNVPEVIKSL